LVELFKFTVTLFKKAKGRKLTSVECHDLCCKIAEIVVVGGVRRSALLSLSNLTDQRMAKAKSGEWWKDNVQRALANNSICFTEKPDVGAFMREWNTIYESKSGERGIFNRVAAKKKVAENGRRDEAHDWGCNPCSEIILRDREFC
jgi:ribonucleoside-diphosphate reductase alpha chain